jgi:deoxycytidine triphosphate deaminase
MQLTGKQIVNHGIITNYCEEGVQQQGIDVRLKNVWSLSDEGPGLVPAKGKTITPTKWSIIPVEQKDGNGGHIETYMLEPGYYEVEFYEACKIPNNAALNYKTRSSLVRCGAIVHSGQFDAGFETNSMGAFLHVIKPIHIDKGARIAQAIVNESYPVDDDNMYNGQWQNDNQRNK